MVRLCDDAARLLDEQGRAEVAALRAALDRPLRVAVVGRVSAGKSTLVNALIGRRVAPTAAGECTQLVTTYRYGSPDRAVLVPRDSRDRPRELALDGPLPDALPVDPAGVDRIEVRLQSGLLRELTLVDTPGLGSLARPGDEATRRAVLGAEDSSLREAGRASAVLFLLRDVEKLDDMELVQAHHTAAGLAGAAAASVIGLLSHADLYGAGPWADEDPFVAAAAAAARMARDHAALLAGVVPVAGLLAEAARTGGVTEDDARTLAALAGTDPVRLQLLEQLGPPEGVDPAAATRLLHRFGPYVLRHGSGPAAGGAGPLREWLLARSGLVQVRRLVERQFLRNSRPLVVDRALRRLEQLSRTRATGSRAGRDLRDLVEQVRLSPATHRIAELRALESLSGGGSEAAQVAVALRAMIEHDDAWQRLAADRPLPPPELHRALDGRRAWAQRMTSTARDPVARDAARVLSRSLGLLAEQL